MGSKGDFQTDNERQRPPNKLTIPDRSSAKVAFTLDVESPGGSPDGTRPGTPSTKQRQSVTSSAISASTTKSTFSDFYQSEPTTLLPRSEATSFVVGDPQDPYQRSKRPPQSKSLADIPSQFRFDKPGKHHNHSQNNQRRDDQPSNHKVSANDQHHHSHSSLLHSLSHVGLSKLGHHKDHHDSSDKESSSRSSSHVELKRFFRHGGGSHSSKPPTPPISAADSSAAPSSAAPSPIPATPVTPRRSSSKSVLPAPSGNKAHMPSTLPFGDDHAGLFKKYGKFGKILGSGAGGSVRLMKRSSDNVTFAVKEFRARNPHESEREYAKKVTAEFCVGSTLHHANIIETLDIIKENGKWYDVMEFAPYDLFAIVMTGKMSREEIDCSFKQILSGVRYLHGLGLAHRDLKLDNCVVNEFGVVKIIDFGCATVFKYPFENDIVEATGIQVIYQTMKSNSLGIVGSDPYLAPEVCTEIRYDPQPADIWSVGIIFCCMTLRRFPWKSPRISDPSYKQFAATESVGSLVSTHHEQPATHTEASQDGQPPAPKPIIKGPWRLLRVLPRDTRPLISAMLTVDPKSRAKMDDIWSDPWFSSLEMCEYQNARGHSSASNSNLSLASLPGFGGGELEFKPAKNHTHTLVPAADSGTSSSTNSKQNK